MRLAIYDVIAANPHGKSRQQAEGAKLAHDSVAVAAGDESEGIAALESAQDAPCARHQLGAMAGVMTTPAGVGLFPAGLRNPCGTIDTVPIGRVVAVQLARAPADTHFAKHGEVGVEIGVVGVEKGTIPVKEDGL